jgi:hypothetical protein
VLVQQCDALAVRDGVQDEQPFRRGAGADEKLSVVLGAAHEYGRVIVLLVDDDGATLDGVASAGPLPLAHTGSWMSPLPWRHFTATFEPVA